jgi:hypothetical protein
MELLLSLACSTGWNTDLRTQMSKQHVVTQGECVSSIAYVYGFLPDTIWNHPDNARLKEDRKVGHLLYPGDVVHIPDRELRYEDCATDASHRFVRKGVPEKLEIVLLDRDDQPRANLQYVLTIDGVSHEGVTDASGSLRHPIPPNAREGRLLLLAEIEEEYPLNLGHLDPVTKISGIQARLANLGFDCGPADGNFGPRTKAALALFQRANDLEPTGEPDAGTTNCLVQRYGS